jgi:hypothetical protein
MLAIESPKETSTVPGAMGCNCTASSENEKSDSMLRSSGCATLVHMGKPSDDMK